MWQYVVTFSLSCAFAGLADRFYRRKEKEFFIFCSFLAVFVGAFLAGVRANVVGTDVMTYGNYVFQAAAYSRNVFTLIQKYDGIIEPLYIVLNFIVSRFTTDVHWFYFVLQMIISSLVYSTLVDIKKSTGIDIWLGFFTYYTVFYSFSLNVMRQMLAMAICIWAMKYMRQRNLKKFVIYILLAAGFHYTSIFYLLIYCVYVYFEECKDKKKFVFFMSIILGCATLGSQVLIQIVSQFVPKYSRYLANGWNGLSINPVIIRIPFVIFLLCFYKKYAKKSGEVSFWIVLLIGDMFFSLLRGMITPLYRISLYFGMIKIIAYPSLCLVFEKKSRWVIKVGCLIVLSVLWYYQVVLQGNDEIYPYVSDVIKILN